MISLQRLKYLNYDVVFQEVPDEVSLAINITNCPHRCHGCHSRILLEDVGSYISNDIDKILNEYHEFITCVVFMGGDQNIPELICLLKKVKAKGLKTCVYSGLNSIIPFNDALQFLDYLKIGSYDESLGGLNSPTTNQIFYDMRKSPQILNNKFQEKGIKI